VHRLVTLEGFGLPGAPPELAPGRYRDWLDQWRDPEPAGLSEPRRVRRGAAQTQSASAERPAAFVARAWSETLPDGRVRPCSTRRTSVNPILYRRAEVEACWAEVRAPLQHVRGRRSRTSSNGCRAPAQAGAPSRAATGARIVAAAGRMVHHDQPAAVAQLVQEFLDR
jgi:pimeloyl-ACP methyl ester carboxylesterase